MIVGILFWPLVGVKYEVTFSCRISCNNSQCVCVCVCVHAYTCVRAYTCVCAYTCMVCMSMLVWRVGEWGVMNGYTERCYVAEFFCVFNKSIKINKSIMLLYRWLVPEENSMMRETSYATSLYLRLYFFFAGDNHFMLFDR